MNNPFFAICSSLSLSLFCRQHSSNVITTLQRSSILEPILNSASDQTGQGPVLQDLLDAEVEDMDEMDKAKAMAARKRAHTVNHSKVPEAFNGLERGGDEEEGKGQGEEGGEDYFAEIEKAKAVAARKRAHTVNHSTVPEALKGMGKTDDDEGGDDEDAEAARVKASSAARQRTHTVGHTSVPAALKDAEEFKMEEKKEEEEKAAGA